MYRQIQSASMANSFVVKNDKFREAYTRLIIDFCLIQNSDSLKIALALVLGQLLLTLTKI